MAMFFRTCLLLACTQLLAEEFQTISIGASPKTGMFATTNQILGQLCLYEMGKYPPLTGLAVDFDVSGLYYDPLHGPNWWNYYFEPISVGVKENAPITSCPKSRFLEAIAARFQLPRARAAEMVKKYIHVKRSFLEKVDQYVSLYFKDFFIIGVHYRGTDKEKEAPRVSYETVFKKILESIPPNRPTRIFVATDEAPFLEEIERRFPDQILAIKAHRSEGGVGIHFSQKDPYELGEEALTDALLLSRSHLLIRTSSNLSLWSTYFNPKLPVILLNRRIVRTLEPE
jgi:hypothetical protein